MLRSIVRCPGHSMATQDTRGSDTQGWGSIKSQSLKIMARSNKVRTQHRLEMPPSQEVMARPERFELPTLWFVATRSIQLSYGRTDAKAEGLQRAQ